MVGPSQIPFWNGIAQRGGMGRLNFVVFHPNSVDTVYVGAPAGGLWRSTNGGASWTVMTDFLSVIGCAHLAINPLNPNSMFLATGDRGGTDTYSIGLLRSYDGGVTWSPTSPNLTFGVNQSRRIRKILINPQDTSKIIVGTTQGIFYSANGGSVFTPRSSMPTVDMEFVPGNPSKVYAVGAQFIRSQNGGLSWTQPFQTPKGWPSIPATRMEVAVTPADSSYVYVLIAATNNGFGGLVRSTDFADSFALMSTTPNILGWSPTGGDTGGQGWYDLALAASPINKDLIFAGGVNVWSSSNGGATWTIRGQWQGNSAPHIHADIHWLEFIPGQGNNLMCANDGGIYRLNAGATNWVDLSNGIPITQIYRMSQSVQNANILSYGAQDNGSNLHDNQGGWKLVWGGDGMETQIDPQNANYVYAASQYGNMVRSINGGQSFSNIKNNGITETGAWVTPYSLSAVDPSKIIAGYDNIWISNDRGDSWNKVTNFSLGTKYSLLKFYDKSSSWAVAIRGSSIIRYINVDNGQGVTINGNLPFGSFTSLAIHPTDSLTMWVTYSGYTSGQKIFVTTNGGGNWVNISANLPNIPCNTVAFDNNNLEALYVGTDVGVYYRDNTMSSWLRYSEDLPNVIVNELDIHQATQKLRAATYGRGIWEIDLYNPVVSGTAVDQSITYLNDLAVYPNPASDLLYFEFTDPSVSSEGIVELYDLSGKLLAKQLLQEPINRLDISALPSGMLFYLVRQGEAVRRGKVIINHP